MLQFDWHIQITLSKSEKPKNPALFTRWIFRRFFRLVTRLHGGLLVLSCDLQPIRWLKKPRGIVLSMSKMMSKNVSLIPRPPSFLPSFYVHSNTWERKTGEKQGRPGSFHHMNDIWWMRGGRRGEGPICTY